MGKKTKIYYVYRYIRKDTNVPFYIGIGTKRNNRNYNSIKTEYERAYSLTNRNTHFLNIIKSIDYEVEIVFETDSLIEIKNKECEFIKLYGRIDNKTGILVNLTDGGDGHFNMCDENRQKLSILCQDRFKGKPLSKEHNDKINVHRIGRVFSKESIEQRTKTRRDNADKRGFYISPEKIKKESIVILQYDRNMVLIREWNSISEASKTLNIPKGNIINVCKNKKKHKTAGGFIWKYK